MCKENKLFETLGGQNSSRQNKKEFQLVNNQSEKRKSKSTQRQHSIIRQRNKNINNQMQYLQNNSQLYMHQPFDKFQSNLICEQQLPFIKDAVQTIDGASYPITNIPKNDRKKNIMHQTQVKFSTIEHSLQKEQNSLNTQFQSSIQNQQNISNSKQKNQSFYDAKPNHYFTNQKIFYQRNQSVVKRGKKQSSTNESNQDKQYINNNFSIVQAQPRCTSQLDQRPNSNLDFYSIAPSIQSKPILSAMQTLNIDKNLNNANINTLHTQNSTIEGGAPSTSNTISTYKNSSHQQTNNNLKFASPIEEIAINQAQKGMPELNLFPSENLSRDPSPAVKSISPQFKKQNHNHSNKKLQYQVQNDNSKNKNDQADMYSVYQRIEHIPQPPIEKEETIQKIYKRKNNNQQFFNLQQENNVLQLPNNKQCNNQVQYQEICSSIENKNTKTNVAVIESNENIMKTLEDEFEPDYVRQQFFKSNPIKPKFEHSLEYSFENYFKEDNSKPLKRSKMDIEVFVSNAHNPADSKQNQETFSDTETQNSEKNINIIVFNNKKKFFSKDDEQKAKQQQQNKEENEHKLCVAQNQTTNKKNSKKIFRRKRDLIFSTIDPSNLHLNQLQQDIYYNFNYDDQSLGDASKKEQQARKKVSNNSVQQEKHINNANHDELEITPKNNQVVEPSDIEETPKAKSSSNIQALFYFYNNQLHPIKGESNKIEQGNNNNVKLASFFKESHAKSNSVQHSIKSSIEEFKN